MIDVFGECPDCSVVLVVLSEASCPLDLRYSSTASSGTMARAIEAWRSALSARSPRDAPESVPTHPLTARILKRAYDC